MVPIPLLHPLSHKPRSSIYRCSSLTSRHTVSSHELSFSLAKHKNALERVAVHNLTAQLLASNCLLPPKLQSTTATPVITSSSAPVEASTLPTPSTPPTPLEINQDPLPEIKQKTGIFNNTTKSAELLGVYEPQVLSLLSDIDQHGRHGTSSASFNLHPGFWPRLWLIRVVARHSAWCRCYHA
jgi:hypothetical protein